jgi:pyruvate dehydrogenase E2 component (dihydrolipoamide acetyltransferase)
MATIELKVPDIGDFDSVEVIELLVQPGSEVQLEQSLITVESEKASMEIPAGNAGRIKELKVKIGDKVTEGSVIALVETLDAAQADVGQAIAPTSKAHATPDPTSNGESTAASNAGVAAPVTLAAPAAPASESRSAHADLATGTGVAVTTAEMPTSAAAAGPAATTRTPPVQPEDTDTAVIVKPHASPSVRKFARELGVDLSTVRATGPKQRIVPDDVRAHVKAVMSGEVTVAAGRMPAASAGVNEAGAGLGLLPWPKVDFAKFGPIEHKPLARIRKISAANLHRNWVMIPHVTHHEVADVTELEAFRVTLNAELSAGAAKFTMLAFLIKACVHALKHYPEFNASLDGDQLVLKQYWHVGFAADTPNGLVVPVIRDADRKSLSEIAAETSTLAKLARDGKLSPAQMQGGTFSISSLGGIGGTAFTPIINAPEVAILGVNRTSMQPQWDGKSFVPRLMLPLSLSYDHRVIDGAAAARFCVHLARLMADFRRVLI